jgi:hypothetical protein
MVARIIIETGSRFGTLTVAEELPIRYYPNGGKFRSFRLICDCGSEVRTYLGHLRSGHTLSCGCSRGTHHKSRMPEFNEGTHHKSGTPEYNAWRQLKQRCENPKCRAYFRYGGREIKVCDAWRASFETFLADMGSRPSDLHSIDRIDVNGDYEPSNCRWATRQEQMYNLRTNREVEFRGDKKCIAAWAKQFNKHPSTLYKIKTSEGVCRILDRWSTPLF